LSNVAAGTSNDLSATAPAITDRSFEVPAATLLKPACAFDGVVNDVTTTATSADGL